MSRSCKKPYVSTCCTGKVGMQKWKKYCNRRIRRIPLEEDVPDEGFIRKYNNRWNAPDDGKIYWDEPRTRRK